ncbi:GtrA family protein [Arenimonas caeni]|jgi:putative flippase GtrA|uniref:GtrA family protein n=1 Tax=Arenimonas caeni TaxID=2058085 RepID=A0A2P6MAX3_9GAMM|nr:GtrA family protein [Arenimonas caeni]MDY0021419.1 GtrA family protein [Arenimonas caeni]PRH83102.1 GtrA family protein [Arenimonas caeni]
MKSEFVRYLASGVVNTLAGYLAFLLALHGLGLGLFAANAASYAVGLTVAYGLNLAFVFRGSRHSGGALARFLAGFAAAYAVNLGVLALAHGQAGLRAELAQVAAMAAYTVSFYLINRHFVWRRTA